MIDWSKPLRAIPAERHKGGRIAIAALAVGYARRDDAMPVKLDQNLWAEGCEGGVWYFNHDGQAIGGISDDGYDARYYLANER